MRPTHLSPEEINRRQIAALANHVSGKQFRLPDLSIYRVAACGAWIRATARKCEANHNTWNNGVRRRQGNPNR